MHRPGHYGAALAVYSPIGFALTAAGVGELALIGGAIVVGGAMVPDWDQRVPFVRHRGVTHTVWFALLVGGVFALVGGAVGASASGGVGAAVVGVFGFLLGVTMITAHVLADALTPMGIRPLAPVRDDKISLDVAKAANPIANYALLVVGGALAAVALVAGGALAG